MGRFRVDTPSTPSAQSRGVSAIEYDVECKLRFGSMIEEPQRKALKTAVEGKHSAWYGPRPVVSWTGDQEAVVFLVVRGSADQASAAPLLVKDAETRVREWADRAGLAGASSEGITIECQVSARA
jgi:hypothetical protein